MSAIHEGIHIRMERGGQEEPLQLEIPLPAEGGVTVLKGAMGQGKTETIAALSEAIGGDGRARRPMELDGLGIRLVVGKRHHRTGELLVTGLDGTDPSILVDPVVEKSDSRDRKRIAALCRLAGASVAEAMPDFERLLGGREELERVCRGETLSTTELVELAARIKRDCEYRARDMESERDKARTAMQAKRAQLEALEKIPEGLPDAATARERHESAVRELAATEGAREGATRLLVAKAEAEQALGGLGDQGTEAELSAARERLQAGRAERERLADALAHARKQLELHDQTLVHMDRTVKAHEQAAKLREHLERQIEQAAGAEPVSDEWLTELRQVRDEAREIAEAAAQAERIRERASLIQLELEALRGSANHHAERADYLRRAAAGTETVLTAACSRVCGERIKIEDGRLMALHPVRGWIPFDELSTGEAYQHAIPIAAKSVRQRAEQEGRRPLLVLKQESWQSLNAEGHAEIRRIAIECGVNIVAAQVDLGELRAEVA